MSLNFPLVGEPDDFGVLFGDAFFRVDQHLYSNILRKELKKNGELCLFTQNNKKSKSSKQPPEPYTAKTAETSFDNSPVNMTKSVLSW